MLSVAEYALDILSVHLYYQVSDSNNMDSEHTKGPKEATELDFGVAVASLTVIPGDGAEA